VGEERSDTELVLAARDEDPAAFGQLFERWFDRSWNVARTILRDDDLAADVAQDTMVKAWQQLDQLRDVDAFGGWLLRSTRNRALNRLAREGRSRASGDDVVSGLRDRGGEDPVGAERQPEPDLVNEIRDRQELVWAAATALGERDVSLLDLHLRHGLSPAEIAEELGVEANAAHQQLFRLRGRLGDAIGSYLLWRNGRPLCDGLAEAVSGRTAFDRSVAKAVARHQANCEHCSGERESMVDPSKLFAAVPLLLVPPHLKAEAAAALQSVGVPTDSSAANADAGSGDPGSADAGSADAGSGSTGSGDAGSADAGSGSTGSPGDGASQASGGPSADGTGAGGSGGGGASGSPGQGIRIDLAGPGQPAPTPVAAAPGTTLAQEVIGSSPGPSALAPSLALPKGRVLALAGVGAVAIAALVAIGAFILQDGDTGDGVAAIASDTPEPLAAAQDGGDEDPAGPASFSPSSTTAASTTQSATGSTEEGRSTTATTESSTTPSSADTSSTATTATSLSTTETTDTSTTPTTGTTRTTPTTGTTRTTPTTGTTRTTPSTGTTSTTDPFVTSSSLVTVTVTVSVTPTPPPADPPLIIRFDSRISRTTLQCLRGQRTYDALWFAEFTDSVSLSLPGTTARGGPDGSTQFCGEAGQTISITARGPGGTATASTTL